MRGGYRADYQGIAHSSCSPFTAGGIRKVLRVKELAATVHRDFKTAHRPSALSRECGPTSRQTKSLDNRVRRAEGNFYVFY